MSVTVHNGECLAGLRSLNAGSVGCIVSDPPFSEHVHKHLGREDRNDGADSRDALSFAHITPAFANELAVEFCRVSQRWIILFCDEISVAMWADAITAAGGQYVRCGAWCKTVPMPQMSGDRPSSGTESIVIGHAPRAKGSGRMRWNGGGRSAVWHGPNREIGVPRVHPTQKPVWLMEALIRDFTDPGELICDPFTGSGSTGVACVRLGRRFIGWEIAPAFHAVALRRLNSASEQLQFGGIV